MTQLPQDSRNNDRACGVQYTTPQDSTGALERCSDTAQATTTIEPVMATQTHSRLATHIARGNVTPPNIPPVFIPPPAPARPPTPPTRAPTPGGDGGGGGGGGGGQPPAGSRGGANPPAVPNLRLLQKPPLKYSREIERKQTASSPNSNATTWPTSESQSSTPGSEKSSSPAPTSKDH